MYACDRKWTDLCGYEQKKMIGNIRLTLFGPIVDGRSQVAADHPACRAAVVFMSKLLTKYCNGEIQANEINKMKHDLMLNRNGWMPQPTMKRPGSTKSKAS